jgi:hypothetical protein
MSPSARLITKPLYSQGEILPPLAKAERPSVKKRDCRDVVMKRERELPNWRFGECLYDCWRKMKLMNTAFERAELGACEHS